ncbi:preprotein translocase subunit SecD [Geosporobacter subterraneus DSM 17957]|uniref:Protein translocase subunit SecD n=1 Tax=Geosporobacter subterraneus DSM 17957 TaxID=1121919 RepID=A0A1M6BSD6_9FIRM|nr:protein translocase subunit SecD [Geosporobacter subterraneus]SHI51513.1 preprotein translocase subunit SecD [Geosporobacter subterraneus DSM 17957]
MKIKNAIILLLIVAIIGAGAFVGIKGIQIGETEISPVRDMMKLGLDLKGGVFVVLEAETDATGDELNRIMGQTQGVIERRVNAMGLTEPNIVREGDKRIRVELPGAKNAQEAIDMIGKTAQLQFVKPNGEVILSGNQVKNAEVVFESNKGNVPSVSLEFNSEGARAFQAATKEVSAAAALNERIIAIILDDQIISAPEVREEIPNGRAVITGNFTIDEASNLAALIRGGALPVNLTEVQTSAIGPTLGLDSLNKSIDAAKIGIALVLLFMIVYYRVPGLIASIALMLYILIVLYVFIGFGATLTLPGVAGLILSIGMAVDANVIIFERLKEELRNGKSLRAAVDSGFARALTTILDANITTVIAGIVLFQFGSGPIRGFAVTLMIGIGVSMFTAVVITKMLLKLFININIFKNTKLYGA